MEHFKPIIIHAYLVVCSPTSKPLKQPPQATLPDMLFYFSATSTDEHRKALQGSAFSKKKKRDNERETLQRMHSRIDASLCVSTHLQESKTLDWVRDARNMISAACERRTHKNKHWKKKKGRGVSVWNLGLSRYLDARQTG